MSKRATSQQIAADHLVLHDPVLATVIAREPLPPFVAHTNYYQALVSSIIGQQLSVKAAAAIEQRFKDSFSGQIPLPEEILARSVDELRLLGLSRPKAAYIQDLAMRVHDGHLQFTTLDRLSNDEIIAELTKVKGIGVWTVHMFLMFCMARPDILPVGDLGIKNGVRKLYQLEALPTAEDIERIARENNWHPYESAASWYIWQSLNIAPVVSVKK